MSDEEEGESLLTSLINTGNDNTENKEGEGDSEELERLQRECHAMVKRLKNLANEEHDLQCQLEILAREALSCGFAPQVVEPLASKRRRTTPNTAKAKPEAPPPSTS